MRRHRRTEFQGRAEKRLLQRLSVGRVVSRPPGRVVEEQCLVFPPRVLVFRGENPSIPGRLAIGIFFLFKNNPKRVALARVGKEIEIVAEYLREAHGQFRGFSRVFHGVKKGIVHAAGHRCHFRFRGNFLDLRREAAIFRDDPQHPISVDFVIDLAQRSFDRTPHRDGIPGTDLAQVEGVLSGS